MDDETSDRIERKLDFVAGLTIAIIGFGLSSVISHFHTLGSFSDWGATLAFIVLPAYLLSVYKEDPKKRP